MRRVCLLVLDSLGVGGAPDANLFGDFGADTLGHIARACAAGLANEGRHGPLNVPVLASLGLGEAAALATGSVPPGLELFGPPLARYGCATEISRGKDTPSGHFEMTGAPVLQDWGYFTPDTNSIPKELLDELAARAGLPGVLGNCKASGIEILARLGEEHLRSGRPIVYTSTDSVFQIAAHEQIWPLERLYALCRRLRPQLDRYRIGRIIARPFVGSVAEGFRRTEGRHDYSMAPPPMLLDALQQADVPVLAVGKIFDLFCGRGISAHWPTAGNADGMARTAAVFATMERGLLFTNLIDFDMLYGHRNDVAGFAAALQAFDQFLEG
ncbi:MAG: phosphopentomutase, partial [Opitutae bacterium]|nr:phosphopentomutase [Opitutae bacterium]